MTVSDTTPREPVDDPTGPTIAPDATPVDDEPAPANDPTAPSSPARRGAARWLPWAVALVALAVALYSTVQWRDLADREAAREDVAAASAAFLVTLTTWDAADGLDDTRTALAEAGTESFRGEVDDLFGGELGAALEEVGARSGGDVTDLFVQRIEGDEALVFAVVTQRIATGDEPPSTTVRGARLALLRDGSRWLVNEVELVEDGLVATPEAP